MNWALKNQLKILAGVILVVLAVGLYIAWPYISREPTCFDGKQNGDEFGVDCGGACDLVCEAQAEELVVLWSNATEIVPGRYNAVAYIQNPNAFAGVSYIRYEFKLYDRDNLLIKKRTGSTFIDAKTNTAIFEGAIDVGNRIPARTTFSFLGGAPRWEKIGSRELSNISVVVRDRTLSNTDTTPLLEATLANGTLQEIQNFDVVAILYDANGNMINASSTYVDRLPGATTQKVYFTWPQAFDEQVETIEIIPRLDLFN